ncbi:MAG TPA: hypothetical protein VN700_07465 [Vicinamibacterales bacterium]|nr:hypothetical protein [Vicinamibacterales bacterium]
MRTIFVAAAVSLSISLAAGPAAAQTAIEIDRTLSKVNSTAIMTSDVRQARLLRLLAPPPPNDVAILTALENRLLMLNEASRAIVSEPAAEQIAARRRAWTATWASPADLAKEMERAGMSDRALDGWFRDDMRIDAYLEQRFPPDPKRDERIAAWIKDLRSRANLPAR